MTPIIHRDLTQGTDEWLSARCGRVTASKLKDVLAKGEGKTRKTYLYDIAGEMITGRPAENFKSGYLDRGTLLEPEARELYCLTSGNETEQVGFVSLGDHIGASPDSLVGDSGSLEIKTRTPRLQIEVLLAGKLPNENEAQVQGGLWIMQREWMDYVSYFPGMPMFLKRVYRDEKKIAEIKFAVEAFIEEALSLVQKIRGL